MQRTQVAMGFACTAMLAGGASARVTATAQVDGTTPGPGPAEWEIYNNQYDGSSTHRHAAQIFEIAFSGYDIWLGDDFTIGHNVSVMTLTSTGVLFNGADQDPFEVQDLYARIYDLLPTHPNATLLAESTGFAFDGVDTWSAYLDATLAPGTYYFAFAARNDFGTNGQVGFYEQTIGGGLDNGWQWNPNGAFGLPGNFQYIENVAFDPTSPNVLITGSVLDCSADCNGDCEVNILDFVCFQQLWQAQSDAADCDGNGVLDALDFVCFQQAFQDCYD